MHNLSKFFLFALIGTATLATSGFAESIPSTLLNLNTLPGENIWGGEATVTPLEFTADKKPATVLIKVPAGQQAKAAHATKDGKVRFAMVLSGTLYYADGETVDKAKEKAYPAGSILLISSGVKHWVSTRDSDLKLLLTATDPANLTPPVKKQLGMME
jgi:quercetin dioxygenase-like cupin family protein